MIVGIIPARYASTRFPGKPLALLHGKPLIEHVYERSKQCRSLDQVVVATDDERIASAVTAFGGAVTLTATHHQSGTERCAEAIGSFAPDADVVINIQGDEPFIAPEQIESLVHCFRDQETQIATLIKHIQSREELFNANVVKVVRDVRSRALYFSRSVIPFQRGVSEDYWCGHGMFYKHIGIYGYRRRVLEQIVQLPANELEKAESLEQLRWLAHGFHIVTEVTEVESIAIDTQEDLQRAERFSS